MTIFVTGANGHLGNEIRIVTKESKDKDIYADVYEEHSESVAMLHYLAGEDVERHNVKLDNPNAYFALANG